MFECIFSFIPKVQKYKSTKVQKYKSTKVQKYKSTKVQKYKSTKVQKYKSTKVHEADRVKVITLANRVIPSCRRSQLSGFNGQTLSSEV